MSAKANVRLPVAERKRFPRVTAVIYTHGNAAISQSTLGYDTIIKRWLQAATLHLKLQTAADRGLVTMIVNRNSL